MTFLITCYSGTTGQLRGAGDERRCRDRRSSVDVSDLPPEAQKTRSGGSHRRFGSTPGRRSSLLLSSSRASASSSEPRSQSQPQLQSLSSESAERRGSGRRSRLSGGTEQPGQRVTVVTMGPVVPATLRPKSLPRLPADAHRPKRFQRRRRS